MLYLKTEPLVYTGNLPLTFSVYSSLFSYLYMYKDNIKQLKDTCHKYIYTAKKRFANRLQVYKSYWFDMQFFLKQLSL